MKLRISHVLAIAGIAALLTGCGGDMAKQLNSNPALQATVMDAISQKLANGTLRLTTRQAFQLHGILRGTAMRHAISQDATLTLFRPTWMPCSPTPLAADRPCMSTISSSLALQMRPERNCSATASWT